MQLDRSPGGELDRTIRAAIAISRASAAEARRLLEAGFPGPAYVWAVRSVEVFVKEVMLRPLFLEEIEGEDLNLVWEQARAKVDDTFRSGKWDRALRKVEAAYGPLPPMRTEDGKDVWSVWKSNVVPLRGDTVHGKVTDPILPSPADAEIVVQWAEQMMFQLTMRLVAGTTHPLHDLFVAMFDKAQQAYKEEQAAG